jgi:hypothetical protein
VPLPSQKVNSNAYVCQWYLFLPLLHFGFRLVFLFFILCNTIAAYCTSLSILQISSFTIRISVQFATYLPPQIKAGFFTVWKTVVKNKWTQDVFKTQI